MDNTPLPAYIQEFNEFMASYHTREVTGEEIGELIARMAQFFASYNLEMVEKERKISLVSRDIESRVDENGKPISSTKAKIFSEATDEMYNFNLVKAHVQNIETYINSLKALQKGALQEYQSMSLT